jgi:hypothetical protein
MFRILFMQMLKEGIHILPTKTTPEIFLKPDGKIKIKGRSVEKKFDTFSKLALDWADSYICDPAEVTRVHIDLEEIDDVHSARLLLFLRKLLNVKLKHKKLIINWHYKAGDEISFKKGEYFSAQLNMSFYFILKPK